MKALSSRIIAALMIAIMLICSSPVSTAEFGSTVITAVAASSKKKIQFKKSKVTVLTGDSCTLTLLNEKGKAVSKNIKWSSANKKIATVSSKGKVTAKKAGKVKIIATYKKKKYNATVTVKNPVLSYKNKTVYVGKSFTQSLKGNGKKISNKSITWKSSNKKVATVSSKGKVKAVAPGKATVSATYKGKTYKSTITVKAEYALAFENKTISAGSSFTQSLKNADGKVIDNKNIIWASGNTDVATVSSKGVVIGLKAGTATISAIYKNKAYKSTVTVISAPVLIITERTISSGESFEQKLKNTDGKIINSSDIIWASDNTDVATVSSKGVVKGISEGTATISAIYKGKVYKSIVTVKKAETQTPTATAPTTATPTTAAPTTATPTTATPTTAAPTTAAPTTAAPTTTAPTTAAPTTTAPTTAAPTTAAPTTAAPTTAAPTTAAPTTATPTTQAPTTEATKPLSVNFTNVGDKVSKLLYDSVSLEWTVEPESSDVKIRLYSDDTFVADVSKEGVVNTFSGGYCTIYIEATRGDEKATDSFVLYVDDFDPYNGNEDPFGNPIVEERVIIKDSAVQLLEGLTHQLDYDIALFNSSVIWTTSNAEVATVDTNGKVTAKSEGTATITAKAGNGMSDTCQIIVGPKVLVLAEPVDKFYTGGPNSMYIQSFYEYCNGNVVMKSISPTYESYAYTAEQYPVVMNYLSEITGEGKNLEIANAYFQSECFHSYGINYTGEKDIYPQLTQQYTDDAVTRYTVTLYCAYDGQIEHKIMKIECSDGLEFRDLGLRYQEDEANGNPKGPSMTAGVSRVNTSYVTTDNRFSAKFGETIVLRNGQPTEFELKPQIYGSGNYATCDFYFKCNDKEYKFAAPLNTTANRVKTYRDVGIGADMPLPFKTEPSGVSFAHTAKDVRGNKIWTYPNYNDIYIDDINMRVFHIDDNMLIMYLYIDTNAYDDDSIIELFTVTDLTALD